MYAPVVVGAAACGLVAVCVVTGKPSKGTLLVDEEFSDDSDNDDDDVDDEDVRRTIVAQ